MYTPYASFDYHIILTAYSLISARQKFNIIYVLEFTGNSEQRDEKGLSNEGEQQNYGKYPTEAGKPTKGFTALKPNEGENVDEQINPLYVNETRKAATTKHTTTTTEKPTTTEIPTTTEKPTTTTERAMKTEEEASITRKIVSDQISDNLH